MRAAAPGVAAALALAGALVISTVRWPKGLDTSFFASPARSVQPAGSL